MKVKMVDPYGQARVSWVSTAWSRTRDLTVWTRQSVSSGIDAFSVPRGSRLKLRSPHVGRDGPVARYGSVSSTLHTVAK